MEDNQVAVLIEDLLSKFRTFGEGLELLNDKVDQGFHGVKTETDSLRTKIDSLRTNIDSLRVELTGLKSENWQEHQQLKQMISELDREVIQLKRVK